MNIETLPEAFSPADCDRILAASAAAESAEARLVRGDTAHNIRRAALVWIDDLPEMSWVTDRLIDVLRELNRGVGFDLDALSESPQVARYTAARAGHFDWHSDIGDGPVAARRKLTVVVQLTDPAEYSGGALELRPSTQTVTAPVARGTATAFPSYVLHRVTPVTEGARSSLTIWAHGPAFR